MNVKIEASRHLHKKIKELIFFIRRSPQDLVATFFAGLFFLAGQWLFNESKSLFLPTLFKQHQQTFDLYKPVAGFIFILFSIGLILWVIYRLWKIALPSAYVESNNKLSHAIKGLLAFNSEDGELFSKLERHRELNELYQYIINPQQQIAVLMGESGAGKTSLLRAGLSHILNPKQISYIYWEAFPDQAENSLLQTINRCLDSQYQQLDEIVKHTKTAVIVLDQFEQLAIDKHPEIFKLLTTVIKHPPPHNITWVIAFRREYDPEWRDYELSLGDYRLLPMLSLKLFSQAQAQNILTLLASEAGLSLDQALVDGFITSMQHQERISPVDISIGLMMLSELASQQQKSYLTLEDYQFAGGSEGLFVNFINTKFERFTESEKQGLLKLLLALIDQNGYKRIAEGKNLAQLLAIAELPENNLQYMLDYLASSHVRLLEKLPNNFYRLPHETIIPALRRLTGVVLAEAEQAALKLKTAYQAWQKSCEKNTGYLLKGKELRQVLKYLPQMEWQTQEQAVFIRKSKDKRTRLRVLSASIVLLFSLSGFYGWQTYQISIYKNALHNWGIPADLYDYQTQLKKLSINDEDVRHLDWLKRLPSLKELDLVNVRIDEFNDSFENTPNLTTLSVFSSALSHIQGLEHLSELRHLDLRQNNLINLDGLGNIEKLTSLTTLNLQRNHHLNSLQGLKKLPLLRSLNISYINNLDGLQDLDKLSTLTNLNLSGLSLSSLKNLKNLTALTTLDLSYTRLNNLQGLEHLTALTTLDLSFNRLNNLQRLEKLTALSSLNLSGNNFSNLQGLENLSSLTSLNLRENKNLSSLQGIENLTALTRLELSGTSLSSLQGLKKLPALRSLNLRGGGKLPSDLNKLTALTTLDLSGNKLKSLQGLEKLTALTTLNLSNNRNLSNLQSLENLTALTSLNLSGNRNLSNLQSLENLTALTSLNLSGNRNLSNLQSLEKLRALTSLNLSSTNLSNLQSLKNLKALTTLNLSNNRLNDLQSLKNLTALNSLNLSNNQVSDLQSLKKLTALTILDLSLNYQLQSLQGLENLSALTSLNLTKAQISSLQGLPVSVTELKLGN